MKKTLALLGAMMMFGGVAEAAKIKVTKAKASAYKVQMPNYQQLVIVGVNGGNLTANLAGREVFNLQNISFGDGGVYLHSLTGVAYNKRTKQVEIKITALENFGDGYESKAKAKIYYNISSKRFRIACAQKVCEVLRK